MARSTFLGTSSAQAAFQQWTKGRSFDNWQSQLPDLDPIFSKLGLTREGTRYFTGDKKSFVDVANDTGWTWQAGGDWQQMKKTGAMGAAAQAAAAAAANSQQTTPPANPYQDAYAKYQAASDAATRQRRRARGTGRQMLIGAGFGTALGRASSGPNTILGG